MAKDGDLRRVGRAVAARRGELGLTQQDLADAAGVDLKTVYNLESGTRWPIARTRSAIAAALGWGPGVLPAIAAGEAFRRDTPVPAASLERAEDDIFPDMSLQMQILVSAHVPAISDLVRSAAIDGPSTAGAVIFREPHEAERWDRLVEVGQDMQPGRGYSLWQLVRLMAVGRVRDDERRAGDAPACAREMLNIT